MSLKTTIWVHGTTAQAQSPVQTEVVLGWGKEFVGRWSRRWFHIPLTSLVTLDHVWPKLPRVFGFGTPLTDAKPRLRRVFVLYQTNGAFIDALHIRDGRSSIVRAFADLNLEGDHTGDIDASNSWDVDPPQEISFGLGVSVSVTNQSYKKSEGQGQDSQGDDETQEADAEAGNTDVAKKGKMMLMPASVLFTCAGAEFEVAESDDIRSGPDTNTLLPYERLFQGRALRSSNGVCELHWEPGGRLVLVNTNVPSGSAGHELFSKGPFAPPGFRVYGEMQGDGNFVVKRHEATTPFEYAGPVWSSGTQGHPGAFLRVEDDGRLVIIDPLNRIWRKPD